MEPPQISPDDPRLEDFTRAFSDDSGSCRMQCQCGKTYFDNYNVWISWEPGELEKLQQESEKVNSNVVAMDGSDGYLRFEGRQYVRCCTCWHKRASQVINFVDTHVDQIAKYINLRKKAMQRAADRYPSVNP